MTDIDSKLIEQKPNLITHAVEADGGTVLHTEMI